MNRTIISTLLVVMLFGTSLCWDDVKTDADFKAALNNTNTKYIGTLFFIYPTSCSRSMAVKVFNF